MRQVPIQGAMGKSDARSILMEYGSESVVSEAARVLGQREE
jgi:hypothetical protein